MPLSAVVPAPSVAVIDARVVSSTPSIVTDMPVPVMATLPRSCTWTRGCLAALYSTRRHGPALHVTVSTVAPVAGF